MITLINELIENNITVSLDEEDLKVSYEGDTLDVDIIEKLKNSKQELIAYLKKYSPTQVYQSIHPVEKQESYALSSNQFRLWVLSQSDDVSVSYNVPTLVRLEGDYDIDLLNKAIEATVSRHESLRTVFRQDHLGNVRQWILDCDEVVTPINYYDLRKNQAPQEYVRNYQLEDAQQPFDLSRGPLFRISIFQLAENEYVLYYNMHHIISDAWSMEVLSKDVLTFYESFKNGVNAPLQELNIHYKDYSAWQLAQLIALSSEGPRLYWKELLSGRLPVLDLPTGKTRPAIKTNIGYGLKTVVSKQATTSLKTFCREHNGSLFMGLLTACNVLLHKYTSATDIIIGSPVAGRNHPDLKEQIGFYVNNLALRNQVNSDHSFLELFEEVKESTLRAYENQMYPFDRIVEDLNLERDISRSPVFDVVLALQNAGTEIIGHTSASDNELIIESGYTSSKVDLAIYFQEVGDRLSFNVAYNINVYEKELIRQFMQHFRQLINAVLSLPQEPVKNINFFSEEEQQKILFDFNNTKVEYPSTNLVALFENVARLTPENTAVVFENKAITYKELDQVSNQLANKLISEYDISVGDLVGVHLDRSELFVISILGILKAGAAYVPIDPEYPVDRKKFMLGDAKLKLLVINAQHLFSIDYYSGTLFAVDVEFESSDYSTKTPGIKTLPTDLAYIIYTSGSTGTPKGVMIEHQGIVNTTLASINILNMKECKRSLQFASFAFDASVFEIFNAILSGSSLYIANENTRRTPEELEKFIEEHKIETTTLPPSFLKLMNMEKLRKVKALITAGEAPVNKKVMAYLANGGTFYNAYGPTETSICATIFEMKSMKDVNSPLIPIGIPIHNTDIYILNEDNHLQPIGVEGEICVGGAGLARGYLHKEELTRQKFIDHPFKPDNKLYKTGDRGRWLVNGNIQFLGRKDDQVKVRGYRIELGEIQEVILAEKQVKEAVVDVKMVDGEKAIVAYVVVYNDFNQNELHDKIAKKLPNFMLPKYYIELDAIPLTSNNKVDRKLLPEVGEQGGIQEKYFEPSSEEEKAIILVCESVLKRSRIGINDNFYSLGGDSIKAIQVVARAKTYGYALRVEDILKNPVLKDLSKHLIIDTRFIDQGVIKGEVALTPVQHYFFGDSGFKVLDHFNQSVLLKSKEAIDPVSLEIAIRKLVDHHDALRMLYKKEGTKWKQYNQDNTYKAYELHYYDLITDEDALKTMADLAGAMQSSLHLEEGPLIRIGHFKLSDGDRLALIIHHLIIDGVSWRVLLEDLSGLYENALKGEAYELPLKTDSFQKWSAVQLEYASGPKLASEIDYWKSICEENVSALTDRITGDVNSSFGSCFFTIGKEETELLQTKVHSVCNTEINDILLTGLGLAIHEVFGVDKTMLKMEGHGREEIIDDIDISRTIGWFTVVYPFLLKVSPGSLLMSLILVKESLRKVPVKGIGYGILKYLTDTKLEEINPSIVFNYLGDFGKNANNSETPMFEYSSEYIGKNSSSQNKDNMDLDVTGILVSGELSMTIKYSEATYDHAIIQELTKAYARNLTSLIHQLANDKEQHLTPSDLTFKGLSLAELSALNHDNQIEDVYPLSPLQQGIYYHWLKDPSSTMYFEQVSYRIKGMGLDLDRVKYAYAQLINKYPILRTSFINDYADTVLQVVKKNIRENLSYEKVPQGLTSEEIANYIEQVKVNDREAGFNLEVTSQMRLKIIDLGNNDFEFIWSHHHILMDGWCLSILINDFYRLLQVSDVKEEMLLPRSAPYSDYIKWLYTLDKNNALAYWEQYLKYYQNVSAIPFKNAEYTGIEKYLHGRETLRVNSVLFERMKELCRHADITQNTLVQGVWGYLLSRYNGTQDVVFGSVVSGRPADLPGVEDMVGLFINTVPVRISYNSEDVIENFLQSIQKNFIDGTSHHYLNLSEIQSRTQLGGDLINHILVFENYPIQDLIKDDVENLYDNKNELDVVSVNVVEQTNYDFEITVASSGSGMSIDFNYNAATYNSESVKQLAKHFNYVLEQFCLYYNRPMSSLKYLSQQEEQELLHDFNDTELQHDTTKTFLDLFKEQVNAFPHHVAVGCRQERYTYAEADQLSNQLANYIKSLNIVERQDIIAIQLDRDEWLVIVALAVFKLGAVYLPIDPEYPESRINYLLNDSKCKYVIDSSFLQKFKRQKEKYAIEFNSIQVSASDLAYVIYTSGSTGNPKGVMIEHAGMLNHMYAMQQELQLDERSIIAQNAPSTFDISIWQLFNSLIMGATTMIYDHATILEPEKFLKQLFEDKVSILQVVPSYLKTLLEIEKGLSFRYLKNLSYLLVTGETVSVGIIHNVLQEYPELKIVNAYGPAEASDDVTLHIITSTPKNSSVPIGKPIQNMAVYILDNNLELCAKNVVGEICVAGIGVARGYLNQPELTSKKFIENPYRQGERLYKTGDIGLWRNDGVLEFIGRKDGQVKIRGQRIELSEIEYHLQSKEEILSCAVLARATANETKELVAYFVASTQQDTDSLRQYLSDRLPAYMLPHYFIQLEQMPLTSNGKINRPSLLVLAATCQFTHEQHVALENKEESLLISICEEILERENISVLDNFFEIGGDSIKSIQLVARLKQRGYSLKMSKILRYSILREMATYMEEYSPDTDQSEVVGKVELTPIQQEFFNNKAIKKHHHYNQGVTLKSFEELNHETVKKCLDVLVKHHDALRMTYACKGNNDWEQYNQACSDNHYNLQYHDLRRSKNELQELTRLGQWMQSSINIEKGPLFKIGHFKLIDGDRVVFILHHLITDGVSWRILMEDFATLYEQFECKQEPQLPQKTDSFKQWALLQMNFAQEHINDFERTYWKNICDQKIERLNVEKIAETEVIKIDSSKSFLLDQTTTELMHHHVLSNSEVNINEVLLTALGLALKKVFDVSKTVIKMEGHGREDIMDKVDISRTVGWFTSAFPFVLNISNNKVHENLQQVRSDLDSIPNNGIGYGMLKYLSKTPLNPIYPSIEFNYLGDFGSKVGYNKDTIFKLVQENIGSDSDKSNGYDTLLNVNGMMVSGQLTVIISYSSFIFNEKSINSLIDEYQSALNLIIEEYKLAAYNSKLIKELKDNKNKPEYKDIASAIEHPLESVEISENQWPPLKNAVGHGRIGPIHISEFSEKSFKKEFRRFLSHYSVLTTTFSRGDNGQVMQQLNTPEEVKIKIRIENNYEKGNEDVIKSKAELYFNESFDVFAGELIRLLIIQPEDSRGAFLYLAIHHSITDMHTNMILRENLQHFFNKQKVKTDYILNTDFTKWQKKFLTSSGGEMQRRFWSNYLTQAFSESPQTIPRSVSTESVMQKLVLTGTLFRQVMKNIQKLKLPVNALLMASHQNLLKQVSSSKIGLQLILVSGREYISEEFDITKVLGVVNNQLPLPFIQQNNGSIKKYCHELYEQYLELLTYQQIPYNTIKTDFQHYRQVDIDTWLAGEFNFQVKPDAASLLSDRDSGQVRMSIQPDQQIQGVDLICVMGESWLSLELICPQYLYDQYTQQLCLDAFVRQQLLEIDVF